MQGPAGAFELETQALGPLPVINHFLGRLGVSELLWRYLPHDDARMRLAPGVVLGVVVANLVTHREPVYALGEWAAPYDPALLRLGPGEAALLNDDRVGRCLARLFDADRASLLTELALGAVQRFGIDCSQLHNDSTSVTFSGFYRGATGVPRGGKPTAAITWGHNKDYRPDLKQLVWVLTVSADAAVPIAYRVESGNTNDDGTHIGTWDALVGLLGRADFLYVADCKLANREAMDHITAQGGRFVTVLPRSRREDKAFRAQAGTEAPAFVELTRRPGRRIGDPSEVYWGLEAGVSDEGYRLVWIRSSTKIALDTKARSDRVERAVARLAELRERLKGPKSRLKTRVAVEEAVAAILGDTGAGRWVATEVTEQTEEHFRQEHRGRPGTETRYRKVVRRYFGLSWSIREDRVAADAASDGCFPLITNDVAMTPAELLAAYKYQPNLERRHAQLKGTQLVAPMFLKDSVRIEGLLCCHFIALLVQALIEREIRRAMAAQERPTIPLYPEDRACGSPSAARVLEIFNGVARHRLMSNGELIQVFEPTLTSLQLEVLELLGIPPAAYTSD
jgi:transposase